MKRLTLADETLRIFGIDPDYTLEYKSIVKKIILWSIVAVTVFACDFLLNCFVLGNIREAIILTIVFNTPLLQNPMVEMNFGTAITLVFESLILLKKSTLIIRFFFSIQNVREKIREVKRSNSEYNRYTNSIDQS